MKTIKYATWIMLGMYLVFGIVQLVTLNRSGLDPAGMGTASAFVFILLAYTIIVGLLSLIKAKWMQITVFFLLLIPMLLFLIGFVKQNMLY